MAAEGPPVRLSVHAADEALRSELMPVNDRYPLADALAPEGTFKVNLIPYNPTGAGFGPRPVAGYGVCST